MQSCMGRTRGAGVKCIETTVGDDGELFGLVRKRELIVPHALAVNVNMLFYVIRCVHFYSELNRALIEILHNSPPRNNQITTIDESHKSILCY
jgi:hypothetical protein